LQILATPKMKICNFHPILQIFSKILQIFQKSAKNGLFLHFFLENLQKTAFFCSTILVQKSAFLVC